MIWLDGVFHLGPPGLPLSDRGALLGDGLFETLAAPGGAPLRVEAHLDRLWRGMEVLGIEPPFTRAALIDAMERVANERDVSLRITLTRGVGPRGLAPPMSVKPRMWITAARWKPNPAPMRAIVSSERRAEGSQLSQLKGISRLQDIIARREAVEAGVDEALLLNHKGRLAEATAANLFVLRGGKLRTPPISEGVLPGVVRQAVLEGWTVEEAPVSLKALKDADGAFLTNSLMGARALVSVDGAPIGDGKPPAIAAQIREALLAH